MAICKKCGAEIEFVWHREGGYWIPVEPKTIRYQRDGYIEILTPTGVRRRVEPMTIAQVAVAEGPIYVGFRPHAPNCIQDDETEAKQERNWWDYD